MKRIDCESCGASDFEVVDFRNMKCSYCGTTYVPDTEDLEISYGTSASYLYVPEYHGSSRVAPYEGSNIIDVAPEQKLASFYKVKKRRGIRGAFERIGVLIT